MKSKIHFLTAASLLVCIFSWKADSFAQSNLVNKYGLVVVKDIRILKQQIAADSNKKIVDIRRYIPNVLMDLKYAGNDNFMHEKLYPPIKTTYLRKQVADSLREVAEDLSKQGFALKIFDAYRPYSVTEKMWEKVPDDRYAADPAKGSGHNRGVAIDLTLVDLATGKELQMPTSFDNFTDTAHHDFMQLIPAILKNRALLKEAMERRGFIALSTEWWHYYPANSGNYELLDIPFRQLDHMTRSRKNHKITD